MCALPEDPAELDQLRASLRTEHQPINTTEEMLVNDLAENFWRLRRMREFETRAMLPENIIDWHQTGLLAVVQRTMASAERGFHKTLSALRRAQKERGFVPRESHSSAESILESGAPTEGIGFVSQESLLAEAKAALREELLPFRDPSGAITPENARAFPDHMKQKCLAQLDEFFKAA